MKKADIVAKIAETTEMTKASAEASLNALIGIIEDTLAKEGKITFTGFGTFSVLDRKARTGRNPQTGKAIKIAASKAVKFKAGKNLQEAAKKAKV